MLRPSTVNNQLADQAEANEASSNAGIDEAVSVGVQ